MQGPPQGRALFAQDVSSLSAALTEGPRPLLANFLCNPGFACHQAKRHHSGSVQDDSSSVPAALMRNGCFSRELKQKPVKDTET